MYLSYINKRLVFFHPVNNIIIIQCHDSKTKENLKMKKMSHSQCYSKMRLIYVYNNGTRWIYTLLKILCH